jgi:hypothetical protein
MSNFYFSPRGCFVRFLRRKSPNEIKGAIDPPSQSGFGLVALWSNAHEAGHGASHHFDRLNVWLTQRRILGIGSHPNHEAAASADRTAHASSHNEAQAPRGRYNVERLIAKQAPTLRLPSLCDDHCRLPENSLVQHP